MSNISDQNASSASADLSALLAAARTELVGDLPPAATELTVDDVVKAIVDEFDLAEYTCYQIHNVVNSAFEVLGSAKRIPPQMMYNYRRNGLIAKGVKSGNFTPAQTVAFATKYVRKNVNK